MNSATLETFGPRISEVIADSWMIERRIGQFKEWLTPERIWQGSAFEAARFELTDRDIAEWWLNRELKEQP